jgi:hypothetical protein
MLFPPTRATCILSEGAMFILAFEIASSGSIDPAARTDAVFMKFLRVDIIYFLLKASKGSIKMDKVYSSEY